MAKQAGHGLKLHRGTAWVDPAAIAILEDQYQLGVAKASNRQGCLEMHAQCHKTLPSLIVPTEGVVGTWLSSRLQRAKAGKDRPAERKGGKTEQAARQQAAGTNDRAQQALLKAVPGTPAYGDCERLLPGKFKDIVLAVPMEEAGGSYVVEKIVGSKAGGLELKVRWEGYGSKDDTWELRGDLEESAARKVRAYDRGGAGAAESESESEEEVDMDDAGHLHLRIITGVKWHESGWMVVTQEACVRERQSHDGKQFEAKPSGEDEPEPEPEDIKIERRLFNCIKRFNGMASVARDTCGESAD